MEISRPNNILQIFYRLKHVSKKKNLSLGHILDILLKKFRAQYSCKVYSYVKREISATNHAVFNVLVLIAHAASVF